MSRGADPKRAAILVDAKDEREEHWWVKIRLPDGSVGWAREIHFDGMYGCG